MRHAHVKNAQGPELLYPTFNSRQSAMLIEETLRISRGHEVNTLTATAMGTAALSSRWSFTTSEPCPSRNRDPVGWDADRAADLKPSQTRFASLDWRCDCEHPATCGLRISTSRPSPPSTCCTCTCCRQSITMRHEVLHFESESACRCDRLHRFGSEKETIRRERI